MKLLEMPFETESDKQWFNELMHKPEELTHNSPQRRIHIKVCGMRDPQNVHDVAQTGVDMMGFIFYRESKRYVGPEFDSMIPRWAGNGLKTVGVFVNEAPEQVIALQQRYHLDMVQLHGNESPEYCQRLKEAGLRIIKAFGVDSQFDFRTLAAWEPYVELFLFDTESKNYGGTGRKFDWGLLSAYTLERPFMLSGGIAPTDAEAILAFEHPRFVGIDLNSRFELHPGYKDTALLSAFNRVVGRKNCPHCPQND